MSKIEEELNEVQAEELQFESGYSHMEIFERSKGSEYTLKICIIGEEGPSQSYNMNENELLALFNLLYGILRRDITRKIEKLEQTDSWEKQVAAYENLKGQKS